jgi:hypothetical protein
MPIFFSVGVASVLLFGSLSAQQPSVDKDPWASCRFLIGDWTGEGTGPPGQGKGEFSLVPDLHGKILLRKSRADYPAAGGRPVVAHEDLMIIYQPEGAKGQKAIYFDSEGHVINYAVTPSPDKQALTFLSEASSSAPRFRLSYTKGEGETVDVKFEIAPPGRPDAFKVYLQGKVRRKNS